MTTIEHLQVHTKPVLTWENPPEDEIADFDEVWAISERLIEKNRKFYQKLAQWPAEEKSSI